MPIETFAYLDSLNSSNPPTSDGLSQGDDHIRGIKATLKASFPSVAGAATVTHTQLSNLGSGTVQFADGTATAPAMTFASSPGSGFYRTTTPGTECIGVANSVRLIGEGAVPTGMIADFFSLSIPTGWYELNGQAVSRTGVTASLFTMFGTAYGAGNGTTTFNLPDFSNRFRRTRGSLFLAGQFVADSIKSHSVAVSVSGGDHNHLADVADPGHAHGTTSGTILSQFTAGTVVGSTGGQTYVGTTAQNTGANTTGITVTTRNSGGLAFTASGSYSGDTETRPMFVTVVTCIKA